MSTYSASNKCSFNHATRAIVERDCDTLEELQKHLTEYPEIAYVNFPLTWIGYGTTHNMLANSDYLDENFPELPNFNSEHHVPRETVLEWTDDSELCELYFMVKNEYPALDDEATSMRETEAMEEALADECDTDVETLTAHLDKHGYSVCDYAMIDNDGYTVYIEESEGLDMLKATLQEEN